MGERVRGQGIEGKIQNLLMVLRYNKDNLLVIADDRKFKVILDCCLGYVKRGRLTKIGMKGIIDIEFENGKTITIKYFPKKRPFQNDPNDPAELKHFSSIMDWVIDSE